MKAISQNHQGKTHFQKLLDMDEKTFFAESAMFLFGKMKALMEGSTTVEDFQQSKILIEGITHNIL